MSQPTRPWRLPRRRSAIRPRAAHRTPHAIDPAARMRAAAAWPLDECLVSTTWSSDAAVTVVWIRRHPSRPRYAVAVLRADLQGGGIEAASGHTGIGRAATLSLIEQAAASTALQRCDPALAAKLLHTATERAATANDPDWHWVSELLGSTDPSSCAIPAPTAAPTQPSPAQRTPSSLAERLRRTTLAMFSPVGAADA